MIIPFPGLGRPFSFAAARGTPTPMAETAAPQILRAYWDGLRRGAGRGALGRTGLPLRQAIDPRGLEPILSGTFLLERIAPGLARVRLAGMDLVDLMGMDVRGMPFSALFDPLSRPALGQALDRLFTGTEAVMIEADSARGLGKPALSGGLMLLPVEDDHGRPNMALGVWAPQGSPGRAPRRLTLRTVQYDALIAGHAAAARPSPHTLPRPALAAFRSTAVPHLRLVPSGG